MIGEVKQKTKSLNHLLDELNILASNSGNPELTDKRLSSAIAKLPNYFEVVGLDSTNGSLILETKCLLRKFSLLKPISNNLYQVIIDQYKSTEDLIPLSKIVDDNRLPRKKVQLFVRKFKSGQLSDYLGINIFLSLKATYIPQRKVNAFVEDFFDWILGNYASFSAIVKNGENNRKEHFFAFEEVKQGKSEKGRILGFYETADGTTSAIVGFYNGKIAYMDFPKRPRPDMESPKFVNYEQDEHEVLFAFKKSELMDRNNRFYFNSLLRAWHLQPVKIMFSGNSYRIYTTNFTINMDDLLPNSHDNKGEQAAKRAKYSNLSEDEVKDFVERHLLQDKFDEISKDRREDILENSSISNETLVNFVKRHSPSPDMVSIEGKKIFVTSKLYPITFWVSKGVQKAFQEFGINSMLPPYVLFEYFLSNWPGLEHSSSREEELAKLDKLVTKWWVNDSKMFEDWQKKLNTANQHETFIKIDKLLSGRIKYDDLGLKGTKKKSDETNEVDDNVDKYLE